ncbi:MAG: hypothetical protein HYY24_07430 [Verrucomicrobia bacterium]|nr:hypothetical protein [Verrucomicrobiota bacterium]
MTLELELPPDVESWLRREAVRRGIDERVLVLEKLKQQRTEEKGVDPLEGLSEDESVLLAEIAQGLPDEVRRRYRSLSEKCRDETLTAEEHRELIALVDRVECDHARRLAHVAKVARLCGISLDEAMRQLELKPASVI